MSLLALATLLGTVLPLLVAIIQQEKWPSRVRALVALVLILVAAAGTTWGKGYWHGWDWVSVDAFLSVLAGMVVGTWGSYHALWSQLGVTQWIEQATTFTRAHKSLADQILTQLAAADPKDVARVTAAVTSMYALTPPDQAPVGQAAAPAVQTLP